jgi:hypothetical protein
MGAFGDCELIGPGILGQPVNTLTTLPFFVLGLLLVSRGGARWVGVALIATGAGSFVFHGPMPAWGEWAHDVSLAWLIATIGGRGTRWERWSRLPALLGLALVFAVIPIAADPVAVALTVVVGASILASRPPITELIPLGLLAVVAILGRLGSTGGPLCDPGSIWQLHGLWHVGAAVAVTWWAAVRPQRETPSLSQR